jgi:NADH-quinone oxidoreductase subunit C
MNEFVDSLKQRLASISETRFSEICDYPCLEIPKERIIEVSKLLKEDLGFDLLVDIVGVDRFTKENRFELIYNLWSVGKKMRIFMRTKLDSKKPEIETVSRIWKTADWEEREAYDMFGINFLNHPDLRRIYMMEEYEYYPLRKDFPLMGIPGSIELPKK